MIRIDAIWLATAPLDMRSGIDSALARVVNTFGAAHPHCAYLFANKRANRIKVLVHDGFGLWLATRRLHQGGFVWPDPGKAGVNNAAVDNAALNNTALNNAALGSPAKVALSHEQLRALVLGLPWQRLGSAGTISVI